MTILSRENGIRNFLQSFDTFWAKEWGEINNPEGPYVTMSEFRYVMIIFAANWLTAFFIFISELMWYRFGSKIHITLNRWKRAIFSFDFGNQWRQFLNRVRQSIIRGFRKCLSK